MSLYPLGVLMGLFVLAPACSDPDPQEPQDDPGGTAGTM